MKMQQIDDNLLSALHREAMKNGRRRMNFDLRTTEKDGSQRMLNVLEVGTKVPIHRHLKTSETVICLEGCLDEVVFEELPNMDVGGPVHDGENAVDTTCFREIARYRICPHEKKYGIQIPPMTWHTIEVWEPSTIFEAKDGAYRAE